MIRIRSELPVDVGEIDCVIVAAFKDTQHTDHTEQFIVRELRNHDALTVSLVAEESGKVLGHVAVSPVAISDGSKDWYGLGPISVLPEYQRSGIGSQLIHQALADLRNLGAAGCVVLGAPSVRIYVVSSKIVSKRGRTGADSEVFRRTQKISAGQIEPAT